MSPNDDPYVIMKLVIKRRRELAPAAALVVVAAFFWFAWRAQSADLVVLGIIVAAVAWFATKLLTEIVALVADSLMPR